MGRAGISRPNCKGSIHFVTPCMWWRRRIELTSASLLGEIKAELSGKTSPLTTWLRADTGQRARQRSANYPRQCKTVPHYNATAALRWGDNTNVRR